MSLLFGRDTLGRAGLFVRRVSWKKRQLERAGRLLSGFSPADDRADSVRWRHRRPARNQHWPACSLRAAVQLGAHYSLCKSRAATRNKESSFCTLDIELRRPLVAAVAAARCCSCCCQSAAAASARYLQELNEPIWPTGQHCATRRRQEK